ncbi:MAG: thioesterase [Cytophagales bacterium]|nr:thioesterase [Cytophagales bacterium]
MKKINVFCFPFAGGSRYSYNGIASLVSPSLNLVPFEYPGRGLRILEPLQSNMDKIVDDLFDKISEYPLDHPYIIYGHSMGTIVGYLITKKIEKKGLPLPRALFFSGASGPSARSRMPIRHNLPRAEFIRSLRELGGSPDEILNDPEVMNFYEPILRADFEAIEKYEYETTMPFDIPIYVITGADEDVTVEQACSWRIETSSDFEQVQFSGTHFFIFEHERELLSYIENKLNKICQIIT